MLILKRLAVWLLETSCVALLLIVLLLALSGGPGQRMLYRDLSLGLLMVAIFMLNTGYLFTTAVFGIVLRSNRLWLYPVIAAVLFTIHLQFLFSVAGGWTLSKKLAVQVAGVCIVLACTFTGNYLLQKWVTRR